MSTSIYKQLHIYIKLWGHLKLVNIALVLRNVTLRYIMYIYEHLNILNYGLYEIWRTMAPLNYTHKQSLTH